MPEGASEEVKNERFKQEGAMAFYNKRKNEGVLCQFINGLDKDRKEVLTNFLIYTGAEVSLISADTIIKESQVHPVSITHQPIVVKGETEVSLNLGSLNTTWKFLFAEKMTESTLGAEFVAEHHKGSWGFKNNKLWFDDIFIYLFNSPCIYYIGRESATA